MADGKFILEELIALSRRIADPRNEYVILGEGNTSARADDESFWVKASGRALLTADASSFVKVAFAPVLALLEAGDLTDEDQGEARRGQGGAGDAIASLGGDGAARTGPGAR